MANDLTDLLATIAGFAGGIPLGVWMFRTYAAWADEREFRRAALARAQAAYDREQAQHRWVESPVVDLERRVN